MCIISIVWFIPSIVKIHFRPGIPPKCVFALALCQNSVSPGHSAKIVFRLAAPPKFIFTRAFRQK